MSVVARHIDIDRGLFDGLAGDGRPLIAAGALGLLASGLFLMLLAATAAFLPHDLSFLGMAADELASIADRRVVAFMIHDRFAFGGSLVAVAILHLWLVRFGLAQRRRLAWLTLTASAGAGFSSFLAFLAFRYLDTWHAATTLLLLVLYLVGLWRARLATSETSTDRAAPFRVTRARALLGFAAVGLTGGGFVVLVVGSTGVFVPSDIIFIGREAVALAALDPELVPLIAHDRAGFGGAVLSTGIATLGVVLAMPRSRSRTQALSLAGLAGFGAAIGIHVAVGYLDAIHLGPAVVGAILYAGGLVLDG